MSDKPLQKTDYESGNSANPNLFDIDGITLDEAYELFQEAVPGTPTHDRLLQYMNQHQ